MKRSDVAGKGYGGLRTAGDEHDRMAAQRLADFKRPEEMPDPQDMLAIVGDLHSSVVRGNRRKFSSDILSESFIMSDNANPHAIESSLTQRSLVYKMTV